MHALLALLGVFFSTVLFYLAAGIEFVGLTFLIVYVGAVAVLFLFVIMLLNVKSLTSAEKLIKRIPQLIAIAGMTILYDQLQLRVMTKLSNTLYIGRAGDVIIEPKRYELITFYVRYQASDINGLVPLYTDHSVLFIVVTFCLLAALLGAIILATVTTERPTRVSDIHILRGDLTAVAILLQDGLPLNDYGAFILTPVCELLYTNFESTLYLGIEFMSIFDERKNWARPTNYKITVFENVNEVDQKLPTSKWLAKEDDFAVTKRRVKVFQNAR